MSELGSGGEATSEGWLDRLCLWACGAAILGMILSIGIDVVARGVFSSSLFGHSDELGGYLLVAIGFLSLSVCQVGDVYHRVEFVLQRLSRRPRASLLLAFDLLSLGIALVLLWQTARLEWISWDTGETAITILETPLWIPRLAMPLGSFALCWALLRTAAKHWRAMGRA